MHRLTIRAQIALLAGLLGVILVGATAGMAMYLAQKRESQVAADRMQTLAVEMARALDTGMFERYREIRGLADLELLRDVWTSDQGKTRSVFDALQRSLPEYAWIGLARPDGVIQAATRGMFEGMNVSDRPWFRNGGKGPSVGDVHDAKMLSNLLRPGNTGEPVRLVDITVPVRDSRGALAGVMAARLNWSWAENLKSTVIGTGAKNRATDIWILARDGSVLLGPDYGSKPFKPEAISAMLKAGSGASLDTASGRDMLDGFAVAKGFREYPGLDWIVVAREPAEIAFAIARGRALKIAMIGAALAGLGLFLFALLGERLARPISTLTCEADQIGRNPNADMLSRLSGSREVELLSGALRSLLRRIGDAEQRTAESEQLRAQEGLRHSENANQLRRLAETDPLTGLLNRRAFERHAIAAMEHFRRNRRMFAVLVIDIDHFKRVNDTHGHVVGDDVIRAVAHLLSRAVRVPDRVARVGGEEFVALLHEVSSEDAVALAERVRRNIAETPIVRGDLTISVTVSIGASLALPGDRDIEDAVSRADAALYQAKAEGRDRTVFRMGGDVDLAGARAA